MSSSGYVPCAGTVPQSLGVVGPTPPIIDPSHSVPDFQSADVTTTGAFESGDVNDPTHSDPDFATGTGVSHSGASESGGALDPQHYGPSQNDSDASALPPLVYPPENQGTVTGITNVPGASGIIYQNPSGPQTYIEPGIG